MRGELGIDDELDVAVLGVEASDQIEHLARLGHRLADVTEVVEKLLEVGGVLGHGEVTLLETAEFGLVVDDVLDLVVVEDAFDISLDGECKGVWFVDDVEDVLGDVVVDPVDHAVVDHAPLGVTLSHGRRRFDVVGDDEFAEDGVEETPPLAVVGRVEVEGDRHMVTDVDGLEDGGRGRGEGIVDLAVAGGCVVVDMVRGRARAAARRGRG